jgi:predicted nucleic acid-binding protein
MPIMVVDSSIWIEYGRDTPIVPELTAHLEGAESVWTPATAVAEVAAYALKMGADIDSAVTVIGDYAHVEPVTGPLSRFAAEIRHGMRQAGNRKWSMMDSYVLALARREDGEVLTLDEDFAGVPEAIIPRRTGAVKRSRRAHDDEIP